MPSRRELLGMLGVGLPAVAVGAVVGRPSPPEELDERWVDVHSEEVALNREAVRRWATDARVLQYGSVRACLVREDREVVKLQLYARNSEGRMYVVGDEAATRMVSVRPGELPRWPVEWPT